MEKKKENQKLDGSCKAYNTPSIVQFSGSCPEKFHRALALNNVAASLIAKGCYVEGLSTLIDSKKLLKESFATQGKQHSIKNEPSTQRVPHNSGHSKLVGPESGQMVEKVGHDWIASQSIEEACNAKSSPLIVIELDREQLTRTPHSSEEFPCAAIFFNAAVACLCLAAESRIGTTCNASVRLRHQQRAFRELQLALSILMKATAARGRDRSHLRATLRLASAVAVQLLQLNHFFPPHNRKQAVSGLRALLCKLRQDAKNCEEFVTQSKVDTACAA